MLLRYVNFTWQSPAGETSRRKGLLVNPWLLLVLPLALALSIAITAACYRTESRHLRTTLESARQHATTQQQELAQLADAHHRLLERLPTALKAEPTIAQPESYLARYGDAAELHLDAAEAFATSDWPRCLAACDRALERDDLAGPTRRDLFAKRAWSLFYTGQTDAALTQLRQAEADDPANNDLLQVQLDMLLMLGRFEEAQPLARDLIARQPTIETLFSLGNLHRGLGEFDQAINAWRQVLAHGSREQERAAAHNLALVFAVDLKDFTRANAYLSTLLSLAPQSPAALATAGRIMLLQGRLNEARDFLTRAQAAMPDSVEVMANLALLYDRLDRPATAHDWRRRAHARDPNWQSHYAGLPGQLEHEYSNPPR